MLSIVAEQEGEFPDPAANKVETILEGHPETQLIWAANEGGLVGAITAARSREGKVKIYGTDMSLQVARALLEEAARLSGISVPQIKIGVFVISSVLAALAGLILTARLEAGQAAVAQGWELDVIAAVIISGTTFRWQWQYTGHAVRGLFMGTLQDGMVLIGVSPFSQGIVSGIVILAAVILGALQTRGTL